MDLAATLLHRRRGFGEVLAATGAHFDFGRDQLADDVRREVGLDRRRVKLLEAVRKLERLRVEERKLLFHCDGEVGAAVEVRAGFRQQLLPGDLLLVTHGRERSRGAGTRRAGTAVLLTHRSVCLLVVLASSASLASVARAADDWKRLHRPLHPPRANGTCPTTPTKQLGRWTFSHAPPVYLRLLASATLFRAPGCYAFQIDGASFSSVVVMRDHS